MNGQRVYPNEEGHLVFAHPGDYGKDQSGVWWARPPQPGFPIGMLTDHQVVEHEDGTITVSPSILSYGQNNRQWHGYLERGVWREV